MSRAQTGYSVLVTWDELEKHGDKVVRLSYAKTYVADSLDDAKLLRARAVQANGWAPETAHDIEVHIEAHLLDGAEAPRQSQQAFRAGLAMVRAALTEAHGPLLNPLKRAS